MCSDQEMARQNYDLCSLCDGNTGSESQRPMGGTGGLAENMRLIRSVSSLVSVTGNVNGGVVRPSGDSNVGNERDLDINTSDMPT